MRVRTVGIFFLFPLLVNINTFAKNKKSTVEGFIATIERVKRSVIPVVCGKFDQAGQFQSQIFEGTAFFVDTQGHFVTPAHVIRDLGLITPQQPVPCVRAIFVPEDGWQREATVINWRWMVIGNCDTDESLDLAVCSTVDKNDSSVPVSLVDIRPPDGTDVAMSGFPLGVSQPLTTRCNIAAYANVVAPDGTRELWLDKGNWPGASGSPIYLEDGSVIGILLARGTQDSVGITMARPSHFILSFLQSKGVVIQKQE